MWGAEGHLGYLPIAVRGWAYWFAAASGITDDPEAMRSYFGAHGAAAQSQLLSRRPIRPRSFAMKSATS